MERKRQIGFLVASCVLVAGLCVQVNASEAKRRRPPGWHPAFGGGTGEPNDPFLIYTAEQMNEVGYWGYLSSHYKLMANIDLSAYPGWKFNAIGPFGGVFDGNGHTILNFTQYATVDEYAGLFTYVGGPDAEIRNLRLQAPGVYAQVSRAVGALVGELHDGVIRNCVVQGGHVVGASDVGGLVGCSYGTIVDCQASCSVLAGDCVGGLAGCHSGGTVENCSTAGDVTGNDSIGGLVGQSQSATLVNCSATGNVNGNDAVGGLVGEDFEGTIHDCSGAGDVSGRYDVGGLIGSSSGAIRSCFATGRVQGQRDIGGLVGSNAGTVTACWAASEVVGDLYVGGLLGEATGTTRYSYATGSVAGDAYVGGLIGTVIAGPFRIPPETPYELVSHCYSTGRSTGGGLVGALSPGTTTDSCFWDVETSGQTISAGGQGITTLDMQNIDTFLNAGWDFVGETENGTEDIWWIEDGVDYPRLWWELLEE